MTVAILFAYPDGPYSRADNVDVWGGARGSGDHAAELATAMSAWRRWLARRAT